jgi:hypothetical protein
MFRIIFSEAVYGLTAAGIALSSTSYSRTLITNSATEYRLDISSLSTGTVTASIPPNSAISIATGLPARSSTSSDNSITYCTFFITVQSDTYRYLSILFVVDTDK